MDISLRKTQSQHSRLHAGPPGILGAAGLAEYGRQLAVAGGTRCPAEAWWAGWLVGWLVGWVQGLLALALATGPG